MTPCQQDCPLCPLQSFSGRGAFTLVRILALPDSCLPDPDALLIPSKRNLSPPSTAQRCPWDSCGLKGPPRCLRSRRHPPPARRPPVHFASLDPPGPSSPLPGSGVTARKVSVQEGGASQG